MKSESLKVNEKSSRLSNIKGMLSRDEMKKVTGGYVVCYVNGTIKFCSGLGCGWPWNNCG